MTSLFIQHIQDIASKPPETIIYVYHSWQDKYDTMKQQVNYFLEDDELLPSKIEKLTENKRSLLVLDDMLSSGNLKYFVKLFTVQARHNNMSVIFLSQLMFSGGILGESLRVISINTDYLVILKNNRNLKQISTLAQQISPGNYKTIVSIYEAATRAEGYSYLLLDLTHSCPAELRYRSHLFDQPGIVRVYVEN